MNVVIAPDSYKGSLSAVEVSETIKAAIETVIPTSKIVMKPMADGGEGTIEALLTATLGETIPIVCTGPLGDQIKTEYAILKDGTAVIEYAKIAGLMQVPTLQRNPDYTTSFGLGEVIKDALDRGSTSFIIGIGGSATNDAGLGMLLALGMKAWDTKGNNVGVFGTDIHRVAKLSYSNLDTRLNKADIKIACDVNNPLYGKAGASYIYGKQKGLTKKQIAGYDSAIKIFSQLIKEEIRQDYSQVPGAGAAGGVGFALLTTGSQLMSGAELLASEMHLAEAISQADLVITGEGQSDEQTLYGKAPSYVAKLSRKYDVPTMLISGSLKDRNRLNELFIASFSITNKPLSLEECMREAKSLLYEQTKQVMRLLHYFKEM